MKRALFRILQTFRHFHVRSKMILIYLIIGVLPFLAFSVYAYVNTNRQMADSEMSMLHNSLEQAVKTVDGTLEMYNRISNYLFNEPSVLTALNKTYGNDYYAMYEAYNKVIAPVFMTYYSLYGGLKRMTIYTSSDILPYNNYVRQIKTVEGQDWFERAKDEYIPTWVAASEDGMNTLKSIRRIGIPSQYRYVNYLCLNVDYDSMFEPLKNLSTEGYGVLIRDADGGDVFSYNAFNVEGAAFLSEVLDEAGEGHYRVIKTGLESSGWTVYYLSDPNSIFGAVTRITNATYYNVWGMLLVLGATAMLFISTLVKPIEQLTQNIQQIDNDHLDITVTTKRTDEVGILVNSFSEMIARIKALIEVTYKNEIEKRDYQQRLLSAQINPHFLYNSLSLINSKAILSDQAEISRTTLLLSQFYRTALNHGRDVTTLGNELNNIRSYVNLQLLMSDHLFQARYEIDERILGVRIPNFILQPIVENAIDHGLKNSASPERMLIIRILAQEGDVVIRVEDNGVGMDHQVIETMFTQQSSGYGIKNVRDRLRLIYEERCDLSLMSLPSEGTVVTLRIPANFF